MYLCVCQLVCLYIFLSHTPTHLLSSLPIYLFIFLKANILLLSSRIIILFLKHKYPHQNFLYHIFASLNFLENVEHNRHINLCTQRGDDKFQYESHLKCLSQRYNANTAHTNRFLKVYLQPDETLCTEASSKSPGFEFSMVVNTVLWGRSLQKEEED